MTNHSFELTNQEVHPRSHMPVRRESMTATVAVRPPFDVPPNLEDIAIGTDADRWNMSIKHTVTVENDGCYFEVLAAEGSEPANLATLMQLGERVVRYADNPSQASIMMREGPFAIQEETF